jgi:hypothetical protein
LAPAELLGIAPLSALAQIIECQLAAVRLDPDHVGQAGQVAPHLLDLAALAPVLADDRLRARISDHPLTLVGRVGRVHGHGHGARCGDREAGQGPFDARVGQQTDTIADLDSQLDQAKCDLVDRPAGLAVCQLAPFAPGLETRRHPVREPLGGGSRQRGHGRGDQVGAARVRHAISSFDTAIDPRRAISP